MKRKIVASFIAALALASVLTGCGGGNKSDYYYDDAGYTNSYIASESYDYYDGYYDDYYEYEEGYSDGGFGSANVEVDDSASQSNKVDTSRKLIKTVSMEVETLEYNNLINAITTQVNVFGGYIEDSYSYNGSKYEYSYNYNSYKSRYGTMTIRIPADNLDEFLDSFSPLCNVLNKTEGVEDVTLTYVDLESRKSALLIEEERLLALLESADSLDDMLTIESRLTDIRYQLESMESQLRTYDNKINYSTVYLSINEVKEITPEPEPEPDTAWERISKGFVNSVENIGSGLTEFGIGLVICLPYIVLWAVIILAHVFIIRGIVKYNINKNKKRRMEAEKKANSLNSENTEIVAEETPYEITVDSNNNLSDEENVSSKASDDKSETDNTSNEQN